jgi:hypothetical protein
LKRNVGPERKLGTKSRAVEINLSRHVAIELGHLDGALSKWHDTRYIIAIEKGPFVCYARKEVRHSKNSAYAKLHPSHGKLDSSAL